MANAFVVMRIDKVNTDRNATMYKILTFSLLLFLIPMSGQAVEELQRFKLFNNCQNIKLVVEDLNEDAKKIKLTREAIINFVESRLRSARIYDENGLACLYVNINVVGNAYSIKTSFHKYVMSYGESGMATTWDTASTGMHGSNATSKGFILSNLSEQIDIFIVEYLRVRQKHCK